MLPAALVQGKENGLHCGWRNLAASFKTFRSLNRKKPLTRIFHTSGFGAPIFNRLSTSSRPQSRLQVGAPDGWHFVRIVKYAG
jgi:hypothetical protein